MRLLNVTTGRLEEFGSEVPRYAILSHTWGEEEVTFKHMSDNVDLSTKQGYSKIQLACQQAYKDSLDYIWIDTCCIDKSSSAELSEAINSMWTYYRNAYVCYAYLVDVKASVENTKSLRCSQISDETFARLGGSSLDSFLNSKWFRRGWTLQELIAPQHLAFYDRDWVKLGARSGRLRNLIQSVTKIPNDVLMGSPDLERQLRHCSVAKRMSWAADRQTSRIEDQAYCLLGIFDVSMPLLYGEGNKAFRRLQEEIIKTSTDHSILARNVATGGILFATSASEYRGCGNIDPCPLYEPMEPYSMTNRGLMITLPVRRHFESRSARYIEVVLNCTEVGSTLTMTLQQLTQSSLPSELPLEYTVLPGRPRNLGLNHQVAAKPEKRRIIIVPRSLAASTSEPPDARSSRGAGRPFETDPKQIYAYNVWGDGNIRDSAFAEEMTTDLPIGSARPFPPPPLTQRDGDESPSPPPRMPPRSPVSSDGRNSASPEILSVADFSTRDWPTYEYQRAPAPVLEGRRPSYHYRGPPPRVRGPRLGQVPIYDHQHVLAPPRRRDSFRMLHSPGVHRSQYTNYDRSPSRGKR